MTDPRTPAPRVLPLVLGILLATGAAGAWWLDAARPVPPDEVARAEAWRGTAALLAAPAPAPAPAAAWADVRADLARQLEALGPAPDDRTSAAARARRPSPAGGTDGVSTGDAGDAAESGATASAALRTTATALAGDALAAEDPALTRVLAAAAVSRATAARQLAAPEVPVPQVPAPAGADLCDAAGDPAPDGTAAPGAVLWSALDRAGYAFEALAARTGTAPDAAAPDGAAPAGAVPAELAARARADVEELLGSPSARRVLAADPGLPAGAYVLPEDVREHPGRVADTAARDVQEAAAHVLARGDAGDRCWALVALERATGLRAGLTGEVDALPGVVRDDPPR
ncbi:hypothetical protein [Kocuria rosea]|uniref:DUF4439 domain-containing protein n=1 Tax=Kocuria rosea TaxID=1275 RepID=A0A4R5YGB9_KOCRO|nr:hypothetical protein [Kocuria rosea]TDL42333.1 hypothetical protein E2R59_10225 [Kocuria rosea]